MEADESTIRAYLDEGDVEAATVAALELYGAEVLGYILKVARHEAAAWDIFQQFSVDVWKGLSGFDWRASLRTWVYTLARNAASRYHRRAFHYRESPLVSEQVKRIAASVKSTLPAFLRPSAKHWLADARAELSLDEQTMLTLRIDRGMTFSEIAQVLSGEGEIVKVVTLRKRFERLKSRLRALAVRDGRAEGE